MFRKNNSLKQAIYVFITVSFVSFIISVSLVNANAENIAADKKQELDENTLIKSLFTETKKSIPLKFTDISQCDQETRQILLTYMNDGEMPALSKKYYVDVCSADVNVWAAGEKEIKGAEKQSFVAAHQIVQTKTGEQKEQINVPKKEVQIKTNGNETNKNKYYSVTDELVCGKVSIKSIATCPCEHDRPLWQLECEQKIFINKKPINIESGLSVLWGCVKDPKTSNDYVVIDFYQGGNCWDCEWTGVWDLEGNLIMDTVMDRTKCTLPRRRERTPEGSYDEFAACPEKLIKKRKENIKYIKELKQGNEKNFRGINFEKEN